MEGCSLGDELWECGNVGLEHLKYVETARKADVLHGQRWLIICQIVKEIQIEFCCRIEL